MEQVNWKITIQRRPGRDVVITSVFRNQLGVFYRTAENQVTLENVRAMAKDHGERAIKHFAAERAEFEENLKNLPY